MGVFLCQWSIASGKLGALIQETIFLPTRLARRYFAWYMGGNLSLLFSSHNDAS